MMSAGEWCDAQFTRITESLSLTQTVDRAYAATNGSDAHGSLRVFAGDVTVVDSRLAVPSMGIDSVMLHAFAPSASTSPHLVSDLAVMPDGKWHFHVDLLPRVDLVAEPDYLDGVYPPLNEPFESAYTLPGIDRMPVPLRLRALSSAWLVGVIAAPTDEPVLTAVHRAYADHWRRLVDEPPANVTAQASALAARDVEHRTELFNEKTDPVWGVVGSIVGTDAANELIRTVRG